MSVYLPIAGLSVNVYLLLALGGLVGFLSGLFGVGGGFLLTPLLMFLGVPPTVAVATGANQVVGASMSGLVAHWRRRNVDLRMGMVLATGGLIGSSAGVAVFAWLHRTGHIDLVISLSYMVLLGLIGSLMAVESVATMYRHTRALATPRKRHRHPWPGLPLKMRFPRSGLYISVLVPLMVGALGGALSAIMGVGGGFIMVPLMIYVLEMPTTVVVGTSLFQVLIVTSSVTLMQAISTHTVDVMLMLTLLAGGVVGAQMGARAGAGLKAEHLRLALAVVVLLVAVRLTLDLTWRPDDLFTLGDKPG